MSGHKKSLSFCTLIIFVLVLSACSSPATPIPAKPAPTQSATPAFTLSGTGGGVIAFLSFNPNDFHESGIVLMNVDGSEATTVPDTSGAAALAWSPDGSQLAFIVHYNDNDWSMYVVNADGSNKTRITQGTLDHFPQWSPNGKQIAFSRNGNIWIMDYTTTPAPQVSNFKQLTTDPKEFASGPQWSPDGTQIVFASQVGDAKAVTEYHDPNTTEIYLMNVDGSNIRKLTDNQIIDNDPSWSPDGKQIGFSSNRDGTFQIYIMKPDGSNVRQLTTGLANNIEPAWSTDGARILFSSDREAEPNIYDIFIMNLDGSNQMRLTDSPMYNSNPIWRPITGN
jgi:Tol biopolymer transport system component